MSKDRPQIECERHHTTICVSDLRASIDFYTEKLGFSLAFTWGSLSATESPAPTPGASSATSRS